MKLSYAHGIATKPLIGKTIGKLLDEVAAEFSKHEALVSMFEKTRFTYGEFLDEVSRCARALMALGVQKGDRVGIWATNCTAWTIVQFATAKIGAILVNINPAYRLHELEYALKQSECNYLIHGEGFKDADYAQMLQEIGVRSSAIYRASCASAGADESAHYKLPHLRRVIPLRDWDAMMAEADNIGPDNLAERQASLDFDDVINIQYTSGTTGFPKGAMLTHHNILNNGFFVGERMRLTHTDRLHPGTVLPLLRDGHGQSRVRQPRRDDGVARASFQPAPHAGSDRQGTLHASPRRADDVHRGTRSSAVQGVRPVFAADGHHGGRALPDRSHETRHRRNALP